MLTRTQNNKYKDIVALASLGQSFINKKETPRKLLLQHATLSHVAAAGSCNANLQDFSSTLAHCCRVIFRSRMLSARIQNGIRCAIPFQHFIFPPYKECDMSDEGAITMCHNPLFVCALNISFLNSSPSSFGCFMDE